MPGRRGIGSHRSLGICKAYMATLQLTGHRVRELGELIKVLTVMQVLYQHKITKANGNSWHHY